MPTIRESKFDCKCIDQESLANLRLSLITSKAAYDEMASKLMRMNLSADIRKIREQATKFHKSLQELDKVIPC